jgi:hypothetical protein
VFANNSQIARCLYRDLCEKVSAENPQAIVAADVPYGKHFFSYSENSKDNHHSNVFAYTKMEYQKECHCIKFLLLELVS